MRFCLLFVFAYILLFGLNGYSQQSTDPLHNRIFRSSGVAFESTNWVFKTGGKIFSSPVVHNNAIFFGSADSCIYSLDIQTGRERWKVRTAGEVHSSPVVHENKLYAGSFDGNYYCIEAGSGKILWKFATGGEKWPGGEGYFGWKPDTMHMDDPWDYFLSSPVIGGRGETSTVYFGSSDHHVYALDANSGVLKWKFLTNGIVHTTPALDQEKLYIGSWDSYMYALDAQTGVLAWKFKTGEEPGMTGIQSSPVKSNGSVYFGARDAFFYSLDARTGDLKWKYAAENAWILSTAVEENGILYVGTSDSYLVLALDALSGREVWRSKLNGYVFGSPALTNKALFIGDFTGRIYSLDTKSGKVVDTFESDGYTKNKDAVLSEDRSMSFQRLAEGKDQSLYKTAVDVMHQLYSLGPFVSSGLIFADQFFIGSSDGKLYSVRLKR